MKKTILLLTILLNITTAMAQNNVLDFTVKDRKGNDVALSEYKGKVLLIVNTATRCGFTPQYEELEALYKNYKEKGFEILDFPCNQFGNQAQGTEEEIHNFCTLNFGTEFPQFKKIEVNGENEDPLFTFLKKEKGFEGGTLKTCGAKERAIGLSADYSRMASFDESACSGILDAMAEGTADSAGGDGASALQLSFSVTEVEPVTPDGTAGLEPPPTAPPEGAAASTASA